MPPTLDPSCYVNGALYHCTSLDTRCHLNIVPPYLQGEFYTTAVKGKYLERWCCEKRDSQLEILEGCEHVESGEFTHNKFFLVQSVLVWDACDLRDPGL